MKHCFTVNGRKFKTCRKCGLDEGYVRSAKIPCCSSKIYKGRTYDFKHKWELHPKFGIDYCVKCKKTRAEASVYDVRTRDFYLTPCLVNKTEAIIKDIVE